MKKVLVILGPTATSKTDLALSLAKRFNGGLVACDSRQVYKGLNIGTGKMPGSERNEVRIMNHGWEIDGIKIYMYDVVDPDVQYTVYDYVKEAEKVIEEILKTGKLPIIVGGTGLYLKALLYGLSNLQIPVDPVLREELNNLSLDKLQQRLKSLSIDKWNNLNDSDRKNPRRLLRSIELISMNPYMKIDKINVGIESKYQILKIGLTAPRQVLYNRIDSRLVYRINQGLIEEAELLLKQGLSLDRMKQLGLEYGVLADYLAGKINEQQFIDQLKLKIHQYAKRQLTWFKKEKEVVWFDITDVKYPSNLENQVKRWYYQGDESKN